MKTILRKLANKLNAYLGIPETITKEVEVIKYVSTPSYPELEKLNNYYELLRSDLETAIIANFATMQPFASGLSEEEQLKRHYAEARASEAVKVFGVLASTMGIVKDNTGRWVWKN
jgi:hypothetical protein